MNRGTSSPQGSRQACHGRLAATRQRAGQTPVACPRRPRSRCILLTDGLAPESRSRTSVAHPHCAAAMVQTLAEPAARFALPLPSELFGLCAHRRGALRRLARQLARHPPHPAMPAAVRRRPRSGTRGFPMVAAHGHTNGHTRA